MDFGWTDKQQLLYDNTLAFARAKLNQTIREREAAHRFGYEEWKLCGQHGLLGLCIPETYGGLGLAAQDTAYAMEAFGKGCFDTGLVFSAAAHLFACATPIMASGSDALKAKYLPPLGSGAWIACNAITEAEAGSDIATLQTTATRDGDAYVLNGSKSFATNAPVADVFLVYATTNPAHGYMGVSAFVVDKDTPGLTVGQPFSKTGLTTSPTASIYLENCRVPKTQLLGKEGQGALVFKSSMHWERACLFAIYVGMMERQLEDTIAYAKQRRQFGKPIARYQAISHKIADMKLRLDSAWLLLHRACWLRDHGHDATLEVSMAKVAISEAAVQSGLDAVQIHGGIGVMKEHHIERMLRDALPSTLFSGTSEVQRNLIASQLGL